MNRLGRFADTAREAGLHRWAIHVERSALVEAATAAFDGGFRLASVAAHDDGPVLRVVYLFADGPPDVRVEIVVSVDLSDPTIPTLAPLSFGASRFEREVADLFGIEPVGHPQPRPLVKHQHWPSDWHPMRRGNGAVPSMDDSGSHYPFAPVEGVGIYEIPVGPVHAGLIEPGHFRFWAVGESILRMKARLWYVHKGIEQLFEGRDPMGAVDLAEKISGDTAVGHGLAFCVAIEDAWGLAVSEESGLVRSALVEWERVWNHVSDIGAMCNDVAFGIVHARTMRLRESMLRINAEMTGHRLLRGGVVPGGVNIRRLPTPDEIDGISEEFARVVELAERNATVRERFEGTAIVPRTLAQEMGLVGVVARASGIECDARVAHPHPGLPDSVSVHVREEGDVAARFAVRVSEAFTSLEMVKRCTSDANGFSGVPGDVGDVARRCGEARRGSDLVADDPLVSPRSGVGIVEGWRGVIVHRVELDDDGMISRTKIVDPSFLNWPALPVALTDTIVPDFPLANKSFNLSYAGNDV